VKFQKQRTFECRDVDQTGAKTIAECTKKMSARRAFVSIRYRITERKSSLIRAHASAGRQLDATRHSTALRTRSRQTKNGSGSDFRGWHWREKPSSTVAGDRGSVECRGWQTQSIALSARAKRLCDIRGLVTTGISMRPAQQRVVFAGWNEQRSGTPIVLKG
jgi:hypothetical protein